MISPTVNVSQTRKRSGVETLPPPPTQGHGAQSHLAIYSKVSSLRRTCICYLPTRSVQCFIATVTGTNFLAFHSLPFSRVAFDFFRSLVHGSPNILPMKSWISLWMHIHYRRQMINSVFSIGFLSFIFHPICRAKAKHTTIDVCDE